MLSGSLGVGLYSAKVPAPPVKNLGWIRIEWSNSPPLWSGVTALEGSTNLVDWYTVWSAQAQVGDIIVTLTNRPVCEFYRAYNSL
jgi:hypothetical protein